MLYTIDTLYSLNQMSIWMRKAKSCGPVISWPNQGLSKVSMVASTVLWSMRFGIIYLKKLFEPDAKVKYLK